MTTEQSTAIAVRPLTPEVWSMIQTVSPAAHLCRFFGFANPEQACIALAYGHELGLPMMASLQFLHIIENKPSLSPRGALALVRQSGLLDGLKIVETDTACTVWMRRKGTPPEEYEYTWSQADSERAGLVKPNGGHVKYPKLMRKWRALGYCIDWLFSDVCAGLKRADEYGADLDPSGNVVEAEWSTVAPPAAIAGVVTSPATAPASTLVSLEVLLEQFGADAILAANGGTIPTTDAQVEAVAIELMGGP